MKKKLNVLDSLEVLSFDNHRTEYPIHYHETYCISLIQKGVFGENDLIAPKGSIVISHPYEIHHNKLIENIGFSFTTFYVSPDVINSISSFEKTTFQNKLIHNPFLSSQLNSLTRSLVKNQRKKNFFIDFSYHFYQFISQLINFHGENKPYLFKEPSTILNDIKEYISNHLNKKIDLSALAKIVGMSKYQFIRWFKTHAGVTPFEYILLKRVGCGKKLIQKGLPLIDVSLDSGFYDQSHFSNYFKKYVGMSPSAYKQRCNIFQDF